MARRARSELIVALRDIPVYPLPDGHGSATLLSHDRQEVDRRASSAERNTFPRLLIVIAAYLITFSCYGSHLPGQEGTTDRNHNVPGTRLREAQPKLHQYAQAALR